MNIGIDIDDTITNTYDVLFNYAQKFTIDELGKEINDVDRSAITKMYTTTFHNWNEEEEKEFFDKYNEEIMKQLKPKLFSAEIIRKLKEENKIYIITSRFDTEKSNVEEVTKKWLKDNFIPYDKLVLNVQNKSAIAKKYDIKIFVDDSIKICEEIVEENIKAFIFDSIINKEYQNEKVTRVYSWPHLYQEIKKYEEEI